jgi:Transmembrane secretion effector
VVRRGQLRYSPCPRWPTQLPAAASLIAYAGSLALLVGPTLGAALLTVMVPPYALGFDALTYAVSAILLMSIRQPFSRIQRKEGRRENIRTDIAKGLRFLWNHSVIRTMTFSVFCACLSWGGIFGLLVVYANCALHITRADLRLGLLYSAGELGDLISIAAVPMLIRRLPVGRLTAAFLVADATALALLSGAPPASPDEPAKAQFGPHRFYAGEGGGSQQYRGARFDVADLREAAPRARAVPRGPDGR